MNRVGLNYCVATPTIAAAMPHAAAGDATDTVAVCFAARADRWQAGRLADVGTWNSDGSKICGLRHTGHAESDSAGPPYVQRFHRCE